VVELGPGTGAVTAALVAQGIEPSRLVLVEFNPTFCRCFARAILRPPWSRATLMESNGCSRASCASPRAAVVSGLPLFNKPLKLRLRLLADAFTLLAPDAPLFSSPYAIVPPIPRSYSGAHAGPPNAFG